MIYQRTELGNAEIRQNRLGLSKIERLLLVLVDGVNHFADLKQQIKSKDVNLLEAALNTLLGQDLIYEVMFVAKGQVPDVVESELLDRFLQADRSDAKIHAQPTLTISNVEPGGNAKSGVLVDTGQQTVVPLRIGEAGLDLYLPLGSEEIDIPPEIAAQKAARKKVKVVQVFPEPNVKKKKRRKKRITQTGRDWQLILCLALLIVALLVIVGRLLFLS